LTKENDGSAMGDYVVVNLDANYRLREWLALGASIQNLLDARYDASIWYKDYGQIGSQHSPAPPLSIYGSATFSM
jgi:iron complex outermembrane recepter protein